MEYIVYIPVVTTLVKIVDAKSEEEARRKALTEAGGTEMGTLTETLEGESVEFTIVDPSTDWETEEAPVLGLSLNRKARQ